jgi:hypothetical protein
MTGQTAAHLDRWLETRYYRESQRQQTLDRILDFLREYPDVTEDHTWTEIEFLANRYAEDK